MQTCQNAHCSRLVKLTDVSSGNLCPYNSLHVVFMKRSSSSGVMPRSAKT
jgi:DNA-directed RNA polymerase subunit RPC12/RpoP